MVEGKVRELKAKNQDLVGALANRYSLMKKVDDWVWHPGTEEPLGLPPPRANTDFVYQHERLHKHRLVVANQ